MLVENLQLALWIQAKNLRGAAGFDGFFNRLAHNAAELVGMELEVVDGNGRMLADRDYFDFTGRSFNG